MSEKPRISSRPAAGVLEFVVPVFRTKRPVQSAGHSIRRDTLCTQPRVVSPSVRPSVFPLRAYSPGGGFNVCQSLARILHHAVAAPCTTSSRSTEISSACRAAESPRGRKSIARSTMTRKTYFGDEDDDDDGDDAMTRRPLYNVRRRA